MKLYQKILISIFFFLLINLISILTISFNLKTVLVDGIIKETIRERIIRRQENTGDFIISEETIAEISDDEKIQEILNSKEVQDLMNKYLDLTVDGMIDEEALDEITIEEDILNYLKDNKEVLSEIVGEEITDEMIDETAKEAESKDFSRAIKQSIENSSKNLTKTEKTILKGYKIFISLKFKLAVLTMIIIDLLLIAIIQKSYIKWIKTLSKALITSGILVIIIAIATKLIVSYISGFIKFNISSLIISGVIISIIGILLLITYSLTSERKEPKESIAY